VVLPEGEFQASLVERQIEFPTDDN
jgi:hypothetical protein